jgi:hypothetical protein
MLETFDAEFEHSITEAVAKLFGQGVSKRAILARLDPDVKPFDRHTLRNAVAILHSIDECELANTALFPAKTGKWSWSAFQASPVAYFLRCDDRKQETLWQIIARRIRNVG